MYASSDTDITHEHRSVFTWRRKNEQTNNGTWEFIPTGQNSVFKIKNTDYNEYLYASHDFLFHGGGYDRRRVFTCNCNYIEANEFNWLVRHEGGNLFSIMNQETKDYLYAAANDLAIDKDRRRVLTWVPGVRDMDAVWAIDCDDVLST